jgi:hypothetical protein
MTSAEEVSRALEARGDLRITRDALQDPGEVIVDAAMVLALELDNAPTRAIFDSEPSALPWGVDEVAVVDAVADSYENRRLGTIHCNRLSVRWEDDRRIELWCREVDVRTTRAAGARS